LNLSPAATGRDLVAAVLPAGRHGGGAVDLQAGPCAERGRDDLLVEVVEVLMGDQHRVGAGDQLCGVTGECPGIHDEAVASFVKGDARVGLLGQFHGCSWSLGAD
jgi:hypothetical protein